MFSQTLFIIERAVVGLNACTAAAAAVAAATAATYFPLFVMWTLSLPHVGHFVAIVTLFLLVNVLN